MKDEGRGKWLALLLVCAAQLMIVLDGTIVNVALPAIESDLDFSRASLSWVVNAYLLTFGGFLLLGGRAGDIFGRRRVFMGGLALFTVASLLCGLAGRARRGAAIIAPAALSIIVTTFTEPSQRARAMGIWGFIASGGSTIGVLLGGVLVGTLGWPWIYLVNLPVGIIALVLCRPLLAAGKSSGPNDGFDLAGAFLITTSIDRRQSRPHWTRRRPGDRTRHRRVDPKRVGAQGFSPPRESSLAVLRPSAQPDSSCAPADVGHIVPPNCDACLVTAGHPAP